MKLIRREASPGEHSLHREAAILRKLRHPGIPVLYDYGEDDEIICLIEEFVRGLSLQEYFLYHPVISSTQIITYVVALCDILEYLHSDEVSIIYQDLKPEHIFIRDGQLMLIDYGISDFLTHSCHTHTIAGTIEYMAPESIGGLRDERSDIYALGVVARQLLQHCEGRIPSGMMFQVDQALMSDPAKRPSSVAGWKRGWEELLKNSSLRDKRGEHHLRRIAVIANKKGAGCTHIAISLVCFLNATGRHAIYENASGEDVCEHILSYGREFREKEGLISHGSFIGMLSYFADRSSDTDTPDGICVWDCGDDISRYGRADIIFYIMSSSLWKTGDIDGEIVSLDNCFTIVNPASIGVGLSLSRQIGRRVYAFPLDKDPFHLTADKKRLFTDLIGRKKL